MSSISPSRPRSTLVVAAVLVTLVALAYLQKTGLKLPWPHFGRTEPAQTLLARGIQAQTLGQDDQALALYRTILEREPGHAAAHYNIGQIQNARGQLVEAQREYEAAALPPPPPERSH